MQPVSQGDRFTLPPHKSHGKAGLGHRHGHGHGYLRMRSTFLYALNVFRQEFGLLV